MHIHACIHMYTCKEMNEHTVKGVRVWYRERTGGRDVWEGAFLLSTECGKSHYSIHWQVYSEYTVRDLHIHQRKRLHTTHTLFITATHLFLDAIKHPALSVLYSVGMDKSNPLLT